MKAAVYLGGRKNIHVKDVPDPKLGEGEALIKIEACNICGVDVRTYEFGDKKIKPPRILGHELAGTVAEIHNDKGGVVPGDRVIVYAVLTCSTCSYCIQGLQNLCDNRSAISYQYDGAFADYMVVPRQAVSNNQIIRIPEYLCHEEAALSEPLGCVLNSHRRLNIGIKDTVAVIGAGPIGLMHCLVSRLEGANYICLMDKSEARLERAGRFGFDSYIHITDSRDHIRKAGKMNNNLGPNKIIVACASAEAQADALEMASKEARIDFFGGLAKSDPYATLNSNLIHYKQLLVTGSYSQRIDDFETALDLISGKLFPAEKFITHVFELKNIIEAFELIQSGDAIKISIKPGH